MKKAFILILPLVIGIIIGSILTYHVNKPKPLVITKDSLIRDSIYIINDSIVKEIEYIEKEHEKEVSNIISDSDSANLVFFSEYLDNFRAAKNN